MIPLVLYLNHHYDFYRTVKIISGIITMIYSAVNHSYDSDRTIKIIPGIITMIYSAVNDSYDSDRTIKIISGIITMIYSAVNDSYDSNRTILESSLESYLSLADLSTGSPGSVLEHSQLQCHAKNTMSSFYKNHLIIN